MNGMHRCALVLLLALASCGSVSRNTVWRGKALVMYEKYIADNPDLSAERKALLADDAMKAEVTTEADYKLLFHLRYGRVRGGYDSLDEPSIRKYFEGGITHHFWRGVYYATNYFTTNNYEEAVEPGWPE